MSSSNLKTGKPAFEQTFGMRVFDWRAAHAEQGALFDSYLAKETLAQAGPIVAALDMSGTKRLADIGGGYGGLLAALLGAHPRGRSGVVRPPAHPRGRAALSGDAWRSPGA